LTGVDFSDGEVSCRPEGVAAARVTLTLREPIDTVDRVFGNPLPTANEG